MNKKVAKKTAKKKVLKKSAKRTKKAPPARGVKNMRARSLKDFKAAKQNKSVIRSVNPYTEQVLHELPVMSPVEVSALAKRARTAQAAWREVPVAERAARLKRLAEVLRAEKRSYATLITQEMGKPIRDALAEVEKCAVNADYYAANAERFLAPEMVATEAKKSYVAFEPLGVILAIEPWNFPFWQVFRVAVPGTVAGNVVLLKHAGNVPMTALAIEDAFRRAGFPEGVFTTLLIGPAEAMQLIDDDLVDAVSLTGSNRAGEEVGARAGRKIKSLVLELGGSDPFVVLDDADAAKAGRTAAQARIVNSG